MGILDKFKDEEDEDVERHEPREGLTEDLPDTENLETGEARQPGHEDERRERQQEFEPTREPARRQGLDMTSEELTQEENEAREQPAPPPPEETRPELPQRDQQRTQQRQRTEEQVQQEASRTQPQNQEEANPHVQDVDTTDPRAADDQLAPPPEKGVEQRRRERDRPTEDLAERFESSSYTGQESQANTQQSRQPEQPRRQEQPTDLSQQSTEELHRQVSRLVDQNETVIELLRRIAKTLSKERRSKHVERHRSL